MKQRTFFAEETRLARLSRMGDPLEKVTSSIDFEIFRPLLDSIIPRKKSDKGGRPPLDVVLMFKIILLQAWYGIADDMTEYLISDRLSFQRFLGLSLDDKVPDAKTIWLYREHIKNSQREKELFLMFEKAMEEIGVITRAGSLVDASFVDVPKQRNSREENLKIKEGDTDELWQDSPNKRSQKDIDAKWAKKNNTSYYGYKDHIKVDKDSKMIVDYSVTSASVHDSKEIVGLIDEKDKEIYADSAYVGEELHQQIKSKSPCIKIRIHEKNYKNKELTYEQKAQNKERSRVRARVEHVFGSMTKSMGGLRSNVIGLNRTRCVISLKNLAYNISRFAYLVGAKKVPILH